VKQWTEKHRPTGIDDVVGNPSAVDALKRWAFHWSPKKKPVLLAGPPGTGKTASALALAESMEWQVLEMNASDLRDRGSIQRIAGLASVSATFSGAKRLILFDEVDGMFRQDYGGSGAVIQVLKNSRNPVVLTANDAYSPKLSSVRAYCEIVKFKKIHYGTIKKRLAWICEAEGVECPDEVLTELAKKQGGDLKSAINDLQAIAEGRNSIDAGDLQVLGERDREENVFNALRVIFKKKSFSEARKAFESSGEDADLFFKWVEENVPREYSGESLVKAFNAVARADVYASRIVKRQHWNLLKYQIDLATGGVSLADAPGGFVAYQFPSLIKKLSSSKSRRAARDSAARKIGKLLHAGRREVLREHLPYLKQLFKQDPAGYSRLFGFDESEREFLGLASSRGFKSRGKTRKSAGRRGQR